MDTQFNSFEEMMEKLNGISFKEAEEMGLTKELLSLEGIKRSLDDVYELENFNSYAAIFACSSTDNMTKEIAAKFNLQIVTYCMGDAISYSTGMHWVNREKYLFCKSKEQGWGEEIIDLDEEESFTLEDEEQSLLLIQFPDKLF